MRFKKYINKFNSEEIQKLSLEGKNIREISKIIDIPEKRLAEMIKEFNLDIKKGFKYKTNDSFFDIIDSEEKAYLLGFFVADGSLRKESKYRNGQVYSYSYRFEVKNSIDDLEIVKLYNKFICPDKKLEFTSYSKGAINRKQQVKIR